MPDEDEPLTPVPEGEIFDMQHGAGVQPPPPPPIPPTRLDPTEEVMFDTPILNPLEP